MAHPSINSRSPGPSEGPVQDLINAHMSLARSIASRFRHRGIDLDDLEQVALLGLTKAARRFDPDAGHNFLSFAVPTIRGEVRRHFRDSGWMVRPPRRIQELQAQIAGADNELTQRFGRSPRPSEIADHLDAPLDDVVEALAADGCFAPASLDLPIGDGTAGLGDFLSAEDRGVEQAEAAMMLSPLLRKLSARDRQILHLRFHKEHTQAEIATSVGLTQAQVSRVLTRILTDLRAGLGSAAEAA